MLKDILKAGAIFVGQNLFFLTATDTTTMAVRGPFLVIAPHPDDETLGCGAFIARAREAGQTVRIVIVLDGAAESKESSRAIAELRRKEALNAAAALGVGANDVVFLNYPDGDGANHVEAIERSLREQIERIHPALVFAPYGADEHPDHRAVALSVERLCRKELVGCPVYEYPVWFWLRRGIKHLLQIDRIRQLRRVNARAYVQTKTRAMRAHHSQYPRRFGGLSEKLFQPFSFRMQFFARYEVFFEKISRSSQYRRTLGQQ